MFVRAVAKLVISGSEDGSVFVWNLQNKQILQTIENAHSCTPPLASLVQEYDSLTSLYIT